MPGFPYTWFNLQDGAAGELNASVDATVTTWVLKAGNGIKFPASDFVVKCGSEASHVATRSTDTLNTLTRGYDGTTASSHAASSFVYQSADRSLFQRIYDNLAGHTHPKADISDFAHNHAQGDVTNLVADLASKASSTHHISTHVYPGGSTFLRADGVFATPAGGASDVSTVKLSSMQFTTTTSTLPVIGLAFDVSSGARYRFEFGLVFASRISSNGLKLGFTFPAVSTFAAELDIPIAAAGAGGSMQGWVTSAGGFVTGTAVQAASTQYLASAYGVIVPSANGALQLRYAAEVAAQTISSFAGSYGRLTTL